MPTDKVITVVFFKTSSGAYPVRDWLRKQSHEVKRIIGRDIASVEITWPIGFPLVTKLDKDLWEVRTVLPGKICRVFFTVWNKQMVLLHSIIKKTQKTPKQDLELAIKRRDIILRGGIKNEK